MSFRPDLPAIILGVLSAEPMHGYAIARRIEALGEGHLKAGEGLLYPALHGLEDAGLVEAQWTVQEGRPDRKVYSLTEKGRGELERRRAKWLAFRGAVDAAFAG